MLTMLTKPIIMALLLVASAIAYPLAPNAARDADVSGGSGNFVETEVESVQAAAAIEVSQSSGEPLSSKSSEALAGMKAEHNLIQKCSSQFDACEAEQGCARAHLELSAGFTNSLLREGSVSEQLSRTMLTHVGNTSESGALLVLCMLGSTPEEAAEMAMMTTTTLPGSNLARRHLNFIFTAIAAGIGWAASAATAAASTAAATAMSATAGMAGFVVGASGAMTAVPITTGSASLLAMSAAGAVYSTVAGVARVVNDLQSNQAGQTNIGADFVMITAAHGICLDASERNSNGGKVHMWECNRMNQNQQWLYDISSNQIKSLDGKCLDASERNSNGGKVHMWDCDTNNWNQQWQYTPSTGQIKNMHGKCLDASERNSNGGKVHMWDCDPTNQNQQWRIGTPVTTRSRRSSAPLPPCWVSNSLKVCLDRDFEDAGDGAGM